jgi:hypothetical protein
MKLHKILTIATLACVLALTASIAKAQGNPGPKNIKAQIEDRKEMNKDVRNDLLKKEETRGPKAALTASSTATSSENFKRGPKDKVDMKKQMEARAFHARMNALLKQLTHAIQNLTDVVTRIESRITKAEASGRNMTEPKALLVTAKQKLEKAKADVLALKNLASSTPSTGTASTTATSTNTTGSTTPQVDLTKPRQIGDAAIKSVKEARDALQKVVVSIAHNMGLGDKKATSTPPTGTTTPPTGTTTPPTGTTTPPTATSTATTTTP